MLDHWWLIQAAQISFLHLSLCQQYLWLGHPSLSSGEEGEHRIIPISAFNPLTWRHTDVLIQ